MDLLYGGPMDLRLCLGQQMIDCESLFLYRGRDGQRTDQIGNMAQIVVVVAVVPAGCPRSLQ